jgi:hypothetical protein
MVHLFIVAALCSTFAGLSHAAGQGSAEDYASGAVHAKIMAIKMVFMGSVNVNT